MFDYLAWPDARCTPSLLYHTAARACAPLRCRRRPPRQHSPHIDVTLATLRARSRRGQAAHQPSARLGRVDDGVDLDARRDRDPFALGIHAGDQLIEQGLARGVVDCRFELLNSASPLKHRAPVHFHAGTAAVEAEVRLLGEVGKPLLPGESAWLRLVLKSPVLLFPGDRFIVRKFSPVVTIGGGVVADNAPPARWKRRAIVERLTSLLGASLPERVRMHALESDDGARAVSLAARCGVHPEQAVAAGVAAA